MELPSRQEGEVPMPMPLNSTYTRHINSHQTPSSNGPTNDDRLVPFSKTTATITRYKECLKNHAAAMGGNATDGCGEFLPGGEEGSPQALMCSACSCHRNFHRKETEGDPRLINAKVLVGQYLQHHHAPHNHHMIVPYNAAGGRVRAAGKKRFRTKFSQEQKERMLEFAEKLGWKLQKQEEGVVQNFCQEVGVKRRVLKVWMHNNKHHFVKKNDNDGLDHQHAIDPHHHHHQNQEEH